MGLFRPFAGVGVHLVSPSTIPQPRFNRETWRRRLAFKLSSVATEIAAETCSRSRDVRLHLEAEMIRRQLADELSRIPGV